MKHETTAALWHQLTYGIKVLSDKMLTVVSHLFNKMEKCGKTKPKLVKTANPATNVNNTVNQSKPRVKVRRRFVSKMGSDFGFNFINSLAESVLLQNKR